MVGRRPGSFGTKTNSAQAEAGARAELGKKQKEKVDLGKERKVDLSAVGIL